MKHKRLIACMLLLAMTLSGCTLPGLGGNSGTLSFQTDSVLRIDIENPSACTVTAVQDRGTIADLVKLINALTLDTQVTSALPALYTVTLTFSDNTDSYTLCILSEDVVSAGNIHYDTDAEDLLTKIEKLECATLTDNALLRRIFEDNYWDTVSIRNDKGELSVDKILDLPDQCPALFELLGRPSAIKSLADSGIDLLEEYASSSSENLRQRAKKLGDILSTLIPAIKDKIGPIFDSFSP